MSKKAETKTETKKKEFSLADLAKQIKKDYGSIHVAADREDPTEFISTGNKALDLSLSGGIAWGYAVEWSGFSTTGKTTLMQMMLADAQKRYGAYGIWVDRENSWFNKRAEQLGIDTSNVLVIKPWDIPTVTDAAAMLKNTLSKFPKDKYKFVAVDSISSFKKGGKIDKSDMGKKPQELHNLFREILSYCDERMSVHFSNHRTYKIGVLFGDNTTTTGGEGPKFYTTYRVQLEELRNILDPKRNKEDIGNWLKATVLKTRMGDGRRKVYFPHYFKTGIPYYGG